MGYTGLVVWVRVGVGGGFQRDTPISLPRSLHFAAMREKKNRVFYLNVIFLLQTYVSISHW
jgi:hypothetical protein